MADEQKRAAVYVPWATFKNSLDQLSQGMPSRIDRSVFSGLAWNVQNQLFAGMKFLGLLKGEDEPTPVLDDLVKGTDEERKAKLKALIEDRYSELIAIDLTKASRAHFETKMGELYSVVGDTREKAVRFFLNAASHVGIPLSTFIAPKEGAAKAKRSPGRAKAAKKTAGTTSSAPPLKKDDETEIERPSGTSKTITLQSGGTLTLSATLDLFSLNPTDRKFVFDIIDKLEGYGAT